MLVNSPFVPVGALTVTVIFNVAIDPFAIVPTVQSPVAKL